MNKLTSFLLYDGLSREQYDSIAPDMHENNRKNLTKYAILLSALFACLLISTLAVDSIAVNAIAYGVALCLTGGLAIALSTIARNRMKIILFLNYLFCSLVLLFCIYIGTFTAQTQLATSFCVALTILPFVTYDKAVRSLIFRLVTCVAFVIVDVMVKEAEFVSRDVVNVCCYFLLGTVLSTLFQGTQAQAFYLKRNMKKEIATQTETIEKMSLQSITAMAAAIDAKDTYTNGHSYRVAKYSEMIALEMGKSKEEQKKIHYVAMLHDVGKIGVPDTIISKKGKLTEEEYEIIKSHPSVGYNILRQIEVLPDIALGAKYHHERYDGTGYPTGIAGENIPEIGRIIAVADAYDAMTSNRSYRTCMSQERVKEEMMKGIGTQFDPTIARHMLDIIERDTDFCLHE